MVRRRGVLMSGLAALFVVSVVAGCSGEQRSAAGASESAVTASSEPSASGSSASAGVVAAGGVPGVPRLSWKAAGHVVALSLRPGPGSASVGRFEVAALKQGERVPDVLTPTQTCDAVVGDAQATSCSLTLKRGGWDVFVRAVNQDGASDWYQGASVSVYRCTDADAAAGVCEEFDTGPGGGFVFYDAGSRQSWGRYLEAAPPGWSGSPDDPKKQWCAKDQPGYANKLATGTQIGTGAANTQLIIQNCGTDSAAGLAAAYRGGGKSDWFLPSMDELRKLYDRRSEAGTPDCCSFWSSSQNFSWSPSMELSSGAVSAWGKYFDYGSEYSDALKYNDSRLRPVRAF